MHSTVGYTTFAEVGAMLDRSQQQTFLIHDCGQAGRHQQIPHTTSNMDKSRFGANVASGLSHIMGTASSQATTRANFVLLRRPLLYGSRHYGDGEKATDCMCIAPPHKLGNRQWRYWFGGLWKDACTECEENYPNNTGITASSYSHRQKITLRSQQAGFIQVDRPTWVQSACPYIVWISASPCWNARDSNDLWEALKVHID